MPAAIGSSFSMNLERKKTDQEVFIFFMCPFANTFKKLWRDHPNRKKNCGIINNKMV